MILRIDVENVLGRGGGRVSGGSPEGVVTAAISSEGLEQLPSDVRDKEPLGASGGELGGDSGGDKDGGREVSFFLSSEASVAVKRVPWGCQYIIRSLELTLSVSFMGT